jgi:hypothetical protein
MHVKNDHLLDPFYLKYAFFQLREKFRDFGSAIGYILLYPFFVWILVHVWLRFNSYQGQYTKDEIYTYVSITELLFITFLRSTFMQRSNADFSITLARPRSWLALTFFGQIGSTLGGRLIYAATALGMLFLFNVPTELSSKAFCRLLILLPLISVVEALMASLLASAQLLWAETRYLVLPFTKIFLALGGVFAPLADYGEPGRSIFLKLPASDLFFQVGHYCLRGEFYNISSLNWFLRMLGWIVFLFFLNKWAHQFARRRHQSFGG